MKRWAVCTSLIAVLFLVTACQQQEESLHGYVEGDYLFIGPTTSGILRSLEVKRGDIVEEGARLFALDTIELNAEIASARAEIAKASAQYDDLQKGERPEKIEVIQRQMEETATTLANKKREYERAKRLIATRTISRALLDTRETEYLSTQSSLDALAAQLKVAQLGARTDEIEAAKAVLEISKQRLIEAKKRLVDSSPPAPHGAYVEDTFFREGEFISAGKPVVSLLPPENIKVRFFVPQAKLSQAISGKEIHIVCDGCGDPIAAKITYISSKAEYTPPEIYSTESRQKLVFMVEAVPDKFVEILHPGLPVTIELNP